MRCFVAIGLPDPVVSALQDLQGGLRVGRIMAPETLHLTLAFLDDQPPGLLAELHDALSSIRQPAFDLSLQGLGSFGSNAPKLLWAGVSAAPALPILRKSVRRAARDVGIVLPRERFRPHVTLARFARALPPDHVADLNRFVASHGGFATDPFRVTGFSLFQSTLLGGGARHDVLADYPLIA